MQHSVYSQQGIEGIDLAFPQYSLFRFREESGSSWVRLSRDTRSITILPRMLPFHQTSEEAFSADNDKPIMVIVHRTWCGACKNLAPKFASSSDIQVRAQMVHGCGRGSRSSRRSVRGLLDLDSEAVAAGWVISCR